MFVHTHTHVIKNGLLKSLWLLLLQ